MRSGDRYSGLDISIAEQLGRDLGCRVHFVPFAWPELLDQLERGDFDLAVSGITMRPERALAALFSRPYARTGVVILTPEESKLRELGDFAPTVRVAVNRGGHLERWTRANLPDVQLETVLENLSLPQLLRSGRVDAIVTDTAEASAWAVPASTLGPLSTDYKAVLVHPQHPELADRIDRWIVEQETNGTLRRMRAERLGEAQTISAEDATMHSFAALARLRLSLMPLVAAAKSSIGKNVTDGAQEQRVIDRARSWSTRPTPRIDSVYRALIELAKKIQRRSSGAGSPPSLSELRDAIRNVDRQIVRELDRLPDRPAGSWRSVLAPINETLPLEERDLDNLARALSTTADSGQTALEPGARGR